MTGPGAFYTGEDDAIDTASLCEDVDRLWNTITGNPPDQESVMVSVAKVAEGGYEALLSIAQSLERLADVAETFKHWEKSARRGRAEF